MMGIDLKEQIPTSVIRGMDLDRLKDLFWDVMVEIGIAGSDEELAVLALNAHAVWKELRDRGVGLR